jgi:hypothetical protein
MSLFQSSLGSVRGKIPDPSIHGFTYPFTAELKLTCQHAKWLGACLQEHDTCAALVDLNLSANQISDEGATSLATALHLNQTLRVLNLANNIIAEPGFQALAVMLKINQGLVAVNFNENKQLKQPLLGIIPLAGTSWDYRFMGHSFFNELATSSHAIQVCWDSFSFSFFF